MEYEVEESFLRHKCSKMGVSIDKTKNVMKKEEKMNRLMDSELRLRTIHELRWILLGLFC